MFRISKTASRFLFLLLAAVMVFGMLPVSVFAADAKKIQGVIVITLDGSVGQPTKLTVQFELF